jgi:hypothetical protein
MQLNFLKYTRLPFVTSMYCIDMPMVTYFLVNKTKLFQSGLFGFGFQTCLIVSGRMWVEVAGTAVITLLVSLLLLYRHVTKSFR